MLRRNFKEVFLFEQELACSFYLGSDKNERYRFKMIDVYNELIKNLTKIMPTLKIAKVTFIET